MLISFFVLNILDKVNKSEIIQSESNAKSKKSHTIPRSKSLLEKKSE